MSPQPDSAPNWASFRDPGGVVVATKTRILRAVRPSALAPLEAFLSSAFGRDLIAQGRFVATTRLGAVPPEARLNPVCSEPATWFEHERIAVPTFPFEWSPRMLHAAARLTLALAIEALPHGFGLKDATPDNVLFRGPNPVFVDALSLELRDPHDPTWLPYAQFVRTFLLPLLANRAFGLPLHQMLLAHREGLAPEQVYRLCNWSRRVRPPYLTLVTIPSLLNSRADRVRGLYTPRRESSAPKAQFMLKTTLTRLDRTLGRVTPDPPSSAWSMYETEHDTNYVERKTSAVASVLARWPRTMVLDVGCNTGDFSILAARTGATVVALDADPAVVDVLWQRARETPLDIQPLVGNLAAPTPATGWMNRERPSLLARLHERFDAVFALAVVHHLLATERVPLDDVITLIATLTTDMAVVEFVSPQDDWFRRLSRGRDDLYRHLTSELFEDRARRQFDVMERVTLIEQRRWLYVLRIRGARSC